MARKGKEKKVKGEKNSQKKENEEKKEVEGEIIKKNEKSQEHILRNVLIVGGVMLLLVVGLYFYTQNQNKYSYKEIEFQKAEIGEITFYETLTLAEKPNGEEFGFRLRTNPNELKKIPFEGVEDLRIMYVNAIASEEGYNFNCEGYGVIAIANLQRLFNEMGAEFKKYENSTCDPNGQYGHFTLKHGEETSIVKVGNSCYDIIIEGNDTQCEILPATEKLMVELYSRYLNLER